MKVIIIGAGFTGSQLARLLVNEKNNVTVIDNDENVIAHLQQSVDCSVICDDGNNLEVLNKAGLKDADALVCVSASDEVNIVTCSLVDSIYPDILKIARVRNYTYYKNSTSSEKKKSSGFQEKHRPLYGIDYMVNPDVEAADAIVSAAQNGAVNVVSFENSEMEIARVLVNEGCVLDGIEVKDVRPKTNLELSIAYIEIDGNTFLPSGNSVINAGCIIGVLISKIFIPEFLEFCGNEQTSMKKIAILGAGRIGTTVAERLFPNARQKSIVEKNDTKIRSKITKFFSNFMGSNVRLAIIENNKELADEAAENFGDANIFRVDPTEGTFIQDEGIDKFDLAICTEHNHELNMVLAAYLESLGVKQTISLVTSSAFAGIAQKLGVDVAIPLKDTVVDSIMSHLRGKSVKEIHTVNNGQVEISECEVNADSKAAGKSLKEISNPGKYLVLLIKSAGSDEYTIPNGNTKLYSGDHVVMISKTDDTRKILSSFGNVQ